MDSSRVPPLMPWPAALNFISLETPGAAELSPAPSPHGNSLSINNNNININIHNPYSPISNLCAAECELANSTSSFHSRRQMWSSSWSLASPKGAGRRRSTSINNNNNNNKSLLSKELSPIREQLQDTPVILPTSELLKWHSSNGVKAKTSSSSPPMFNFVRKYRRMVENYATQNNESVGFTGTIIPNKPSRSLTSEIMISATNPTIAGEIVKNENDNINIFKNTKNERPPLRLWSLPQCQEEKETKKEKVKKEDISNKVLSASWNPEYMEAKIIRRRCLSASRNINSLQLPKTAMQGSSLTKSPFFSPLISPELVIDTGGMVTEIKKRPVPLRRSRFDRSDSNDSSLGSF